MKKEPGIKLLKQDKFVIQLFVAGMSAKSMEAVENIKLLCAKYPEIDFDLEIVDIYKNPDAAIAQHIVFSPSLIKYLPLPKKVLIGTLSDKEKVIKVLGLTLKA